MRRKKITNTHEDCSYLEVEPNRKFSAIGGDNRRIGCRPGMSVEVTNKTRTMTTTLLAYGIFDGRTNDRFGAVSVLRRFRLSTTVFRYGRRFVHGHFNCWPSSVREFNKRFTVAFFNHVHRMNIGEGTRRRVTLFFGQNKHLHIYYITVISTYTTRTCVSECIACSA